MISRRKDNSNPMSWPSGETPRRQIRLDFGKREESQVDTHVDDGLKPPDLDPEQQSVLLTSVSVKVVVEVKKKDRP